MNPTLLREILIGIRDAKPINDAAERIGIWDRFWSANGDLPTYFGPAYARGIDGDLTLLEESEYQHVTTLRTDLFNRYLANIAEVSEFGCGTGHNLMPLIGTGKRLRGFDWSEAAIKRVCDLGIEGEQFDMFEPDHRHTLSGVVLTVHAMEQLGARWRSFIYYLIRQKSLLCIHIEPIEELYDETNLPDFLARYYHRKRRYLSGFLTGLREMEARGEAKILEARRTFVGGLMHEANSVICWEPR